MIAIMAKIDKKSKLAATITFTLSMSIYLLFDVARLL